MTDLVRPFNTLGLHLFARPSFASGMARLVDWFGVLNEYNSSPTGQLADYYALRSDWMAVGNDIYRAIETYQQEIASSR